MSIGDFDCNQLLAVASTDDLIEQDHDTLIFQRLCRKNSKKSIRI